MVGVNFYCCEGVEIKKQKKKNPIKNNSGRIEKQRKLFDLTYLVSKQQLSDATCNISKQTPILNKT